MQFVTYTPKELDALGRKNNRFVRIPIRVRVLPKLTSQELVALQWLNYYPYLRSSWLMDLMGIKTQSSRTRFTKRLEILYNGAVDPFGAKFGPFLDRPPQQQFALNARRLPIIYTLDKKGIQALNIPHSPHSFKKNEFPHSVMICDILADIEFGCREFKHIRFVSKEEIMEIAKVSSMDVPVSISHQFERGRESLKTVYRADGWFSLEFKMPDGSKRYRHHCLEVNNADNVRAKTLKVASHLKKFLSLDHIIRNDLMRTHFKMRGGLFPIFVQTEDSVTRNSKGLLAELGADRHILFATMPIYQTQPRAPILDGSLLTREWDTLNGPFRIDRP